MDIERERKMLQLIILSLDVSPNVVRQHLNSCILMQSYAGSLQNFLNHKPHKHDLFHLRYNTTPCCECGKGTPHLFRDNQIRPDQFMLLYKADTGDYPHEIIKEPSHGKTYISQYCLCRFNANPTLIMLDLPSLWIIYRNCCKSYFPSQVQQWITTLKDIRNFVCHVGSLNAYPESEIDTQIKDIEDATLNLAGMVNSPNDMFKKGVMEQIKFIKLGTFNRVDVAESLQKMETHIDVHSQEIIDKICKDTESLKSHTTNLQQEILYSQNKNAEEVKSAMTCSFAEQATLVDGKMISLKEELLCESHEKANTLTTKVEMIHEDESQQLQSIQENTEVIIEIQTDQSDSIHTIQHISGEVMEKTTETHKKQSKQTDMMEDMKEQLDQSLIPKEEMGYIAEFSKNISIDPNVNTVLTTKQTGKQTQCTQTEIECMQFQLGSSSTTRLQNIICGDEKIDNTGLKNILLKNMEEMEKQSKTLCFIDDKLSNVKSALDHHLDKTSEENTQQGFNEKFEESKNITKKILKAVHDTKEFHTHLSKNSTETISGEIQSACSTIKSVEDKTDKITILNKKLETAVQNLESLMTNKEKIGERQNNFEKTLFGAVHALKEDYNDVASKSTATICESLRNSSINQANDVCAEVSKISLNVDASSKLLDEKQSTIEEKVTDCYNLNGNILEAVGVIKQLLTSQSERSTAELTEKLQSTSKQQSIAEISGVVRTLDDIAQSSEKNIATIEQMKTQHHEDMHLLKADMELLLTKTNLDKEDFSSTSTEKRAELLEMKKKNEDLKNRIQELEKLSKNVDTLDFMKTRGFATGNQFEQKKVVINETLEMFQDENVLESLTQCLRGIRLLALISKEWKLHEDKNLPSISFIKDGKSYFLSDACKKYSDHFKTLEINMYRINQETSHLLKKIERLMCKVMTEHLDVILKELQEAIKGICAMTPEIQIFATENSAISTEILLEIEQFICDDIWMSKLSKVQESFKSFSVFHKKFVIKMQSLYSWSSELSTNTMKLPHSFLKTDNMCVDVCELFQMVVVVKNISSCYLKISRKCLTELLRWLDLITASSAESLSEIQISMPETDITVKEIVTEIEAELNQYVQDVFAS